MLRRSVSGTRGPPFRDARRLLVLYASRRLGGTSFFDAAGVLTTVSPGYITAPSLRTFRVAQIVFWRRIEPLQKEVSDIDV